MSSGAVVFCDEYKRDGGGVASLRSFSTSNRLLRQIEIITNETEGGTHIDDKNRFSSASVIPQMTTVPYSNMNISASVGTSSNLLFFFRFPFMSGLRAVPSGTSSGTPSKSPVCDGSCVGEPASLDRCEWLKWTCRELGGS